MIRRYRLANGTLETDEVTGSVAVPPAEERVWLRVVAPTPQEIARLVEGLPVHELAMEDALREGHPPKVEDFGDHLFFIAHTPCPTDEEATRKLAVLLGKNWVATVERVLLPLVDQVEARVLRDPARYLQPPEWLAHAMLDHMVDGFEKRVDELIDGNETLEEEVLGSPGPEVLATIVSQRTGASQLARVVRGQRDVTQALARGGHPVLSKRVAPYLRDVYDHCLRVHDLLVEAREGLGVLRDGYLSAVNNRLSETMRVLTVIATIMMPLSLVAGIFGMNFVEMPLLQSSLGFWLTMGAMGAVAAGMIAWFRRHRWV